MVRKHSNFTVSKSISLREFVKELFPEKSFKEIKRGVDRGMCLVNGKSEKFASRKLVPGDRVQLDGRRWEGFQTTWDSKRILFEDDDLLLYDKPPGVVSERGALNSFFPAHRLDKETSGVILLAKNEEILLELEDLFSKRLVKKIYLTVVQGVPKEKSGRIESCLGPIRQWAGQKLYGSVKSRGKVAITEWKLIEAGKGQALLEVSPLTGRTHQIRCHMAEMGHPVIGDLQYGKVADAPRVLLHARQLTFPHPLSGDLISISAPIPQDFKMC